VFEELLFCKAKLTVTLSAGSMAPLGQVSDESVVPVMMNDAPNVRPAKRHAKASASGAKNADMGQRQDLPEQITCAEEKLTRSALLENDSV